MIASSKNSWIPFTKTFKLLKPPFVLVLTFYVLPQRGQYPNAFTEKHRSRYVHYPFPQTLTIILLQKKNLVQKLPPPVKKSCKSNACECYKNVACMKRSILSSHSFPSAYLYCVLSYFLHTWTGRDSYTRGRGNLVQSERKHWVAPKL